jgi:hypothetical protein
MTARQIVVAGAMPSRDANGRALAARLRFYLPGTTTPASVYADSGLSVAHPFPLVSDGAGRWPAVWTAEDLYFDVAWSDLAQDALIASFANVRPLDDALAAGVTLADAAADAAQTAADAAAATLAQVETLGEFPAAIAQAQAAAAAASASASASAASATASAAYAAGIDLSSTLNAAKAFAICAAAIL